MNKGPSNSLKQHRLNKSKGMIKFWYETKSSNQVASEFMSIEEAEVFLETCNCYIVGIQIVERMNSEEAMEYLKKG